MSGLRERKRADARRTTLDHAFALFAERGYEDVTVADICASAAIGRRTFFRYFPTKDHLLHEPVRAMTESVATAIAATPASVPDEQALRTALTALARDLAADRDLLLRMRQVLSGVRTSSFAVQSEQEAQTARNLLTRRGESTDPDWRLRLMVARVTAGFRIWLDDFLADALADPLAHLNEVLDQP